MPATIAEKGQYALAFIVVSAMLVVAGFPSFVVFFFGIFAYFLWKIFSTGSKSETREIFEFYLAANDILREDERRWFGFEIHEVVSRGERIVKSMGNAPPLVYFALGALLSKIGEYKSAVSNLEHVIENKGTDELNYVFPSTELRNYVKVLRKIEREPAEAPLTSAAVRSLERARRNRGRALLDESRRHLQHAEQLAAGDERQNSALSAVNGQENGNANGMNTTRSIKSVTDTPSRSVKRERKNKDSEDRFSNRKPITEVLHDIYDENTH